ncbi:MAG TPA: hypothetical protein EYH05_13410, partial [Anaerolineae bacterium]|nr:hypothetical protein [Anaerolineae bacterium]
MRSLKNTLFFSILLLFLITACGQKDAAQPLPTAAAAATPPPIAEGANAVIVVEEDAPAAEPGTAVSSDSAAP